jgi:ADP-ribose pyrophosphatase YjhB (NUDIX family)
MIEHHIQIDIMNRLSSAEQLRFSELKPDDLESNAFMYHLKQLMSAGYIEKHGEHYRLDLKGLTYVDSLTTTNSKPRKQPKIVTVFALKNKSGKYLMVYRKLQPSLGTWMLLSGKQHFGESAEEHAEREMGEQLGADVKVTRRGLMDIRVRHRGAIVVHLVAHIYAGDYDGPLPKETMKFRYDWVDKDDELSFTAGTLELIDEIETSKSLFFLSLDVSDE